MVITINKIINQNNSTVWRYKGL